MCERQDGIYNEQGINKYSALVKSAERRKDMTQNRFKSWVVVVTSILDLALFILVTFGLLDDIGLTTESWQAIVGMLVIVGTNVFAALNNPTSKTSF